MFLLTFRAARTAAVFAVCLIAAFLDAYSRVRLPVFFCLLDHLAVKKAQVIKSKLFSGW